MKNLLPLLISLVLLTGCSNFQKERLHAHDCEWSEVNRAVYCKYKGKPYTGEVWSDDDKTFCIEHKNGMLVSFSVYYENGQLAAKAIRDGETSEDLLYDESNNEISVAEFDAKVTNEMGAVINKMTHEIDLAIEEGKNK